MTALGHRIVRDLSLLLLLFTATRLSCAAEADEGFYVGIGIGVAHISEDATLVDDSSTAYKALFGYQLNKHASLEASFVVLDDYEAYSLFVDDAQRAVANGQGLNAAAVFRVPIADRFEINARIGMLFWNADSNLESIESSGSDLSFGLGVVFRFNESLGIRLDLDALNFGDVTANVGTATLEYRF